jgi:hypothetical protein
MFKRATWLGVGFGLGVGATVVAARKAREQLDRYKPNAVVDRVTTSISDKASGLRHQVAVALDDGKQAARDREEELRASKPKLTIAQPLDDDDVVTVEVRHDKRRPGS